MWFFNEWGEWFAPIFRYNSKHSGLLLAPRLFDGIPPAPFAGYCESENILQWQRVRRFFVGKTLPSEIWEFRVAAHEVQGCVFLLLLKLYHDFHIQWKQGQQTCHSRGPGFICKDFDLPLKLRESLQFHPLVDLVEDSRILNAGSSPATVDLALGELVCQFCHYERWTMFECASVHIWDLPFTRPSFSINWWQFHPLQPIGLICHCVLL